MVSMTRASGLFHHSKEGMAEIVPPIKNSKRKARNHAAGTPSSVEATLATKFDFTAARVVSPSHFRQSDASIQTTGTSNASIPGKVSTIMGKPASASSSVGMKVRSIEVTRRAVHFTCLPKRPSSIAKELPTYLA